MTRWRLIALALAAGWCIGVEPLKPIVPIGCRDLVLMCVCDSRGDHCGWDWICVGFR